jgi:hypothetical protein
VQGLRDGSVAGIHFGEGDHSRALAWFGCGLGGSYQLRRCRWRYHNRRSPFADDPFCNGPVSSILPLTIRLSAAWVWMAAT